MVSASILGPSGTLPSAYDIIQCDIEWWDYRMTTATIAHIKLDEQGTAWIDNTNVKVIEVVLDKLAHGESAEETHLQYPHLTVAQIYSALAYYHDHQAEFDAQIENDFREFQALRNQSLDSPGRRKLRALGKLD